MHCLFKYRSIADGITKLFYPSAEVVLHDIKEDCVYYISNSFSSRKSGDMSLLKLDNPESHLQQEVIGPYEKAGERGQRIRSITSVLKDEAGNVEGLMCINLDYSVYERALDLLTGLVHPSNVEARPDVLFQNDWRDLIKLEIRSFLAKRDISIENLDAENRKTLIENLEKKNLLYAKKSIEQVSSILNVSRATTYNDLKAAREAARQKTSTRVP